MLEELKCRLYSVLGELILTYYALLFLLARIPSWIRRWFTGAGAKGGGGGGGGKTGRKMKSGWGIFGGGGKKEKRVYLYLCNCYPDMDSFAA